MLEAADRDDRHEFPNLRPVDQPASVANRERGIDGRRTLAMGRNGARGGDPERQISAREAVAACVTRMHAVNPQFNAVTVDLSAEAVAVADRADAAVARGETLGPLHGVPVTIKENVDQEGCATTNGVVAFRDVIAPADSPSVAN